MSTFVVVSGKDSAPDRGARPAPGGPDLASVGPVLFKAACPECRGRFELAAAALRLAIGATPKTTFYSFTCPLCDAAVRKPAGERIVQLLTDGGVRTLRLHAPGPRTS